MNEKSDTSCVPDGGTDQYEDCPKCGGSGMESHGRFSWGDCPKCNGHGFVHRSDLEDGE